MSRQKKIKVVQKEANKTEVTMSEEATATEEQKLETTQIEIDKARVELENLRREISELASKREVGADEANIVKKQISRSNESKAAASIIEKQKKIDNVPVTGKFINRRAPGMPAKLTYIKYVDDPVKWYEFEDGKVYTIPRGFAEQINEHYYSPHFIQKQGTMDPNAPSSAIHEVDTSNKKYAFVPVNF